MASPGDGDSPRAKLEADLQELKCMIQLSKRDSVRQELLRVQAKLEAELSEAGWRTLEGAPAGSPAEQTPPKTPFAKPAPAAAPSEEKAAAAAAAASAGASAPSKAEPAPEAKHVPVAVDVKTAGPWTEITTFALDLGGYDKPVVTVDIRLKGIESLPSENISCDFTMASFDLKVVGLDGQNYRFLRTNLEKDIVARESSFKVKKKHVIISLQKVKGQYGYDSWMDLCAKGRRKPTTSSNDAANPRDGIMDMMKDLYEDGDDNMKRIIGEAMYKANRGEKYEPKAEDLTPPQLPGAEDI